MKKLLLLSLLVASCSSFAQVAGPTGLKPQAPTSTKKVERVPSQEMDRINAEILDKLGLSDDAKAKIKAHEEEMKTKRAALRKEAKGGDKEAAKEKQKALRKENTAFMRSVLNKQQLRELARLRKEAVEKYQKEHETVPAKP